MAFITHRLLPAPQGAIAAVAARYSHAYGIKSAGYINAKQSLSVSDGEVFFLNILPHSLPIKFDLTSMLFTLDQM